MLLPLDVEHRPPHPVGHRPGRDSLGREGFHATLPQAAITQQGRHLLVAEDSIAHRRGAYQHASRAAWTSGASGWKRGSNRSKKATSWSVPVEAAVMRAVPFAEELLMVLSFEVMKFALAPDSPVHFPGAAAARGLRPPLHRPGVETEEMGTPFRLVEAPRAGIFRECRADIAGDAIISGRG